MKKIWKVILWILGVLIVLVVGSYIFMNISVNKNPNIEGERENIPTKIAGTNEIIKGEADWPNWRGPNFDGKSQVTGIRTDWSDGLKKVWEVSFLCQGQQTSTWSAPVIVGDRLVIPGRDETSDLVFCINANTGELIWQGSYEAAPGTAYGPGMRATPFIDDSLVYTFGRAGDLVCWQLRDGTMLWRQNVNDFGGVEAQHGHSTSPVVYKDIVVVQGGGEALVLAFNKYNGELIWKSHEGIAGFAASILVETEGDTNLLVFHGKGLACMDPETGTDLWLAPWEFEMNATTPAVEGDVAFITAFTQGCQAVQFTKNSFEVLWKNDAIDAHHSDPIIVDGYIYGYSGFSGRNKAEFQCVDLMTGEEKWITKEIGQGTVTYVDGHLICMDVKGNLFLVKPDPNAFQLVDKFENALNEVRYQAWTVPVVANGKLYVRYLQTLICYDLMPV